MNRTAAKLRMALVCLTCLLIFTQPGTAAAGLDWAIVNLNDPSTSIEVFALAVDQLNPANIYAGGMNHMDTDSVRFYKSTNGGGSWIRSESGLPLETDLEFVKRIVIDPLIPSSLYAILQFRGVYKSTDGGESWDPAKAGLPAGTVYTLAVNPLTSSTLYAGTSDGVFKSSDGGGAWSPADTLIFPVMDGLDVTALAVHPTIPLIIYAGTYGHGVYKCGDGGTIWLPPVDKTSLEVTDLQIDPLTPTTVYLASTSGVYKSTDAGVSWMPRNTGLESAGEINTLLIDRLHPAVLYAGTNAGVYRSTDGAETWTSFGLSAHVKDLALAPLAPRTLFAARVSVYSRPLEAFSFLPLLVKSP